MESYTPLLERTRVPQPSLQRYAVISIFSKLRSAPPHLDADSEPGRDAITQCLHSTSPAVVDQSVRELCRLVTDSKLDLSRGLLELQSSLEGSDSRFVGVFVKGICFLVRTGFQRNNSWLFNASENHPFVKILSCQAEVQSELVEQVLLFMAQNKRYGIVKVCDFLRPFLNFSILRISLSNSTSSSFVRHLISSMASLGCSFHDEAMPILKLLVQCLKYYPCHNAEDFRNFNYIMEYLTDAYIVVLRHLVDTQSLLINEAQLCGVELLDTILSLCTDFHKHFGGIEHIVELSRRLLAVQKEIGLQYVSELSSVMLSFFVSLGWSELEHEQLSVLKLLLFLLQWKSEKDFLVDQAASYLSIDLLFIYPVINYISSPSKFVKEVASDLLFLLDKLLVEFLVAPMKEVAVESGFPATSKPGVIVFRLLQHLWYQGEFLSSSYFSIGHVNIKETSSRPKSWVSKLREYSLWIMEKRKSSLPLSRSQEIFLTEMPLSVSAIVGIMVLHDTLGSTAVDSLAVIGTMDPKVGVTMLLAILYYINIFCRKDIGCHDMLLKLMAMLPSLASHSVMIPLIVQTILPMLRKDSKPPKLSSIELQKLKLIWQLVFAITRTATKYCDDVLAVAEATRLLCKTWESNDRAFGSLQGVLLPKMFTEFKSERNILLSMAASIRDICKKNPDRGVDLILSVSACIESQDPIIQATGFESLAHLCEADVVDFYTAWDVIAKHVLDYLVEPIVAHSLCLLLRWGAMDAEAYIEASRYVLQILWQVGISRHHQGVMWAKARVSAFEAIIHFEVLHIEGGIPDFKKILSDLLISEANVEVLRAMEGFLVKIISYEHTTRRRLVKEKKAIRNKVEKLLNVVPQVLLSSGKNNIAREQPGAALLCLSFIPKDVHKLGANKGVQDVHARYENALVDIASSLQLSRNILVALLSLQSWKSFVQSWMRAYILSLDAKASSITLDKTSKAANDILKSMRRIAEEALPRSAENIALAIGALCMVLPSSAHVVKSNASNFLLNWVFQYEHEHRQWSAAISLGLISSCLHVTDHKQKLDNIGGLLEVSRGCKSTLVKGACGIGLGLSCQDLLTRVGGADDSKLDKETFKMQETKLLAKIVRALVLMICQLNESSFDMLQSLSVCLPLDAMDEEFMSEMQCENCDELEEDIWGVAGLVLGLGCSLGAIYRAGAHDDVLKIKSLIILWFSNVSPVQNSECCGERSEMVLSVGSCLALPIVAAFCQRVELMDNNELDHLIHRYRDLISQLVSVKMSDTFQQSLLMASCIGAGSLLACILNEGVHSVEVEDVKGVLELFKKCYSNSYPPLVHFGGMLGVINSLGAGAGNLMHTLPLTSSFPTGYEHKESASVMVPLLSSPVCETHLTSMIQEIFLVLQSSDDSQLQQYAAWALSFLRHHLWSEKPLNDDNSLQTDSGASKSISQTFSEDSVVMKMSLWLMHLNYSERGVVSHPNTVATVLRCLSRAPRLPALDWGAIIRRCMRYEAQIDGWLLHDPDYKKGSLREESLLFSLAHADQHDSLQSFLDELSDLPRFGTLELNLQSCVLVHLTDLIKLFSGSRLDKLFDDVAIYFSLSTSPFQGYSPDQKSLLRVSCWKGLYQCLDEASLDSLEYISHIEKCVEVLFCSLYALQSDIIGVEQLSSMEEWFEAVKCLGKVRRDWLLDLLEVSHVDIVEGDHKVIEVVKKIQARARLVRMGSIPLTELGRVKAFILNSASIGIWDLLVEVVAALQHAEGSIKRQWLVDTIEISCMTKYPSKALQFLGLLSGSCCKYMPLLILDRLSVLSDLPVTLTSLLSDPNWGFVAETVVSHLFTALERIYKWAKNIAQGDDTTSLQPIDKSENDMADFLLHVLHTTCVSLNNYLPFEKQLRLANMVTS